VKLLQENFYQKKNLMKKRQKKFFTL